mmetsp:Transcript_648/g.1951  ORF Transcript_648/g.1951 Transcript_648/m.1951 type:complete len:278 (+) Transcript_648:499-1332(+)
MMLRSFGGAAAWKCVARGGRGGDAPSSVGCCLAKGCASTAASCAVRLRCSTEAAARKLLLMAKDSGEEEAEDDRPRTLLCSSSGGLSRGCGVNALPGELRNNGLPSRVPRKSIDSSPSDIGSSWPGSCGCCGACEPPGGPQAVIGTAMVCALRFSMRSAIDLAMVIRRALLCVPSAAAGLSWAAAAAPGGTRPRPPRRVAVSSSWKLLRSHRRMAELWARRSGEAKALDDARPPAPLLAPLGSLRGEELLARRTAAAPPSRARCPHPALRMRLRWWG